MNTKQGSLKSIHDIQNINDKILQNIKNAGLGEAEFYLCPNTEDDINQIKANIVQIAKCFKYDNVIPLFNVLWSKKYSIKINDDSQFNEIRKFYVKIASIGDTEFENICNTLKFENYKDMLFWKKLIDSYYIEEAYKTVVPDTPIDFISKIQSWASCYDENCGTGLFMPLINKKPVGFIGLTKIDQFTQNVEINYVVFDKFKGHKIAEKLSRVFIQNWQKMFNQHGKIKVYGEAFKNNYPSISTLQNLGGQFIQSTPWPKDKSKLIEQYLIPTKLHNKVNKYGKSHTNENRFSEMETLRPLFTTKSGSKRNKSV